MAAESRSSTSMTSQLSGEDDERDDGRRDATDLKVAGSTHRSRAAPRLSTIKESFMTDCRPVAALRDITSSSRDFCLSSLTPSPLGDDATDVKIIRSLISGVAESRTAATDDRTEKG